MKKNIWIFVEETPFLQRLAPFSTKELCQKFFRESLEKTWPDGAHNSETVDGNGNTFDECVELMSWWDGERASFHAYEVALDADGLNLGFPFLVKS